MLPPVQVSAEITCTSSTLSVIPIFREEPEAVVYVAEAPEVVTTVVDAADKIPSPRALMGATLNFSLWQNEHKNHLKGTYQMNLK